jgi:hypothetical protein
VRASLSQSETRKGRGATVRNAEKNDGRCKCSKTEATLTTDRPRL